MEYWGIVVSPEDYTEKIGWTMVNAVLVNYDSWVHFLTSLIRDAVRRLGLGINRYEQRLLFQVLLKDFLRRYDSRRFG